MLLPQELITSVISEIDDVPTLRSCALASTRTLEPSQRRLFANVVLAVDNLRRFRDTPHLPTYTKVLVIECYSRWAYSDFHDNGYLGEALSQFTDVRTCTLDLGSMRSGWQSIKEPIQLCILSFFKRQPALDEVHILSNGWFPLSAALEMVGTARRVSFLLTALAVNRKLPDAQNAGDEVPAPSSVALQNKITSESLAWLGHSGFFRRTQHLSIILTPTDKSPPSISRLLELAPSNLQRLSLFVPNLGEFNNGVVMNFLKPVPNRLPLAESPGPAVSVRLTASLDFTTQYPAHEWVLRTIAALLLHGRLPSTCLRRITYTGLQSKSWAVDEPESWIEALSYGAPKELDEALAAKATLPLLFRIEGTEESVSAARNEFAARMPASVALGLLDCEAYIPPKFPTRVLASLLPYDPWGYI